MLGEQGMVGTRLGHGWAMVMARKAGARLGQVWGMYGTQGMFVARLGHGWGLTGAWLP